MNALEDRLRDALEAAAGTVPDHATGPGLAREGRTAHRPVRRTLVVLGAAAAVVAAVAVPLAIKASDDRRDGTATPACPMPSPVQPSLPTSDGTAPYDAESWGDSLPAGAAPRIPYTVTDSKTGAGYLQDGTTRIPLRSGERVGLIDRLACGWLVTRGGAKGTGGDLGVLGPDGTFVRLSPAGQAAAVSPDRSKIAVVPENSRRLSVIDVATHAEVASRTVGPDTGAYAWTVDGIWYSSEDSYHQYAYVWQPGSEPRKLTHDADEFLPAGSSKRILLPETRNGTCIDVLELAPSGEGTTLVLRRCGKDESRGQLSPDGGTLVTETGKAYRVPENTPTGLELSHEAAAAFSAVAWEDPQHVLLDASYGTNDATGRQVVVRCDVISGACERIYDAQRQKGIAFGHHL